MAKISHGQIAEFIKPFQVKPGSKVRLPHDFDAQAGNKDKRVPQAKQVLGRAVELLADYQARLAAQDSYGLLVVLQAMDAAGKDGTIRHVMSGVNPQGVSVHSFKVPSSEDLDHDFLWRYQRVSPERGSIAIFNRSHYEEVLVVRVHPELLERQKLPRALRHGRDIWQRRYRSINDWEHHLVENGIRVVKIFLNVSNDEQRRRFLSRIDEPEKNWKFSRQRRQGAHVLGRLPEGVRRNAQSHQHRPRAVVRRAGRQQAFRARRLGRHHRPRPDRHRPALPTVSKEQLSRLQDMRVQSSAATGPDDPEPEAVAAGDGTEGLGEDVLEQPVADGAADGLTARGHAELRVDRHRLRLDRVAADAKPRRDLLEVQVGLQQR